MPFAQLAIGMWTKVSDILAWLSVRIVEKKHIAIVSLINQRINLWSLLWKRSDRVWRIIYQTLLEEVEILKELSHSSSIRNGKILTHLRMKMMWCGLTAFQRPSVATKMWMENIAVRIQCILQNSIMTLSHLLNIVQLLLSFWCNAILMEMEEDILNLLQHHLKCQLDLVQILFLLLWSICQQVQKWLWLLLLSTIFSLQPAWV